MAKKNTILIIDDIPRDSELLAEILEKQAVVNVEHPNDVTVEMLKIADLVLVDYLLDQWPERLNTSEIALQPMNGIALSEVLRSHLGDSQSPTAFALCSAEIKRLSAQLPTDNREHAIARTHNFEWVFNRMTPPDQVAKSVKAIATAVAELPREWPVDDESKSQDQLCKFLSLPSNVAWEDSALEDIQDCLPPIHELAQWNHGLTLIRWMLHRILPYPTFLWDMASLALRLRITLRSLSHVIQENGELTKLLTDCAYSGALWDFNGLRWWRSAIEATIWDHTQGNSFDQKIVLEWLQSKTKVTLEAISIENPVLCVDENYKPTGEPCAAKEAVRIQPDDWPGFADQAWITVKLAKSVPQLRALVIRQDRERLSTNAG